MWDLLAQVPEMPVVIPKSADPWTINMFLLSTLYVLCGGAFTYLLGVVKQFREQKEDSNTKMLGFLQEMVQKSESRLTVQMAEHDKDRAAYMLTTNEIKNAVVESTNAIRALSSEVQSGIREIQDEIRRSGERRAIQ